MTDERIGRKCIGICPVCGTELTHSVKYCLGCGTAVEEMQEIAASAEEAKAVAAASALAAKQAAGPDAEEPEETFEQASKPYTKKTTEVTEKASKPDAAKTEADVEEGAEKKDSEYVVMSQETDHAPEDEQTDAKDMSRNENHLEEKSISGNGQGEETGVHGSAGEKPDHEVWTPASMRPGRRRKIILACVATACALVAFFAIRIFVARENMTKKYGDYDRAAAQTLQKMEQAESGSDSEATASQENAGTSSQSAIEAEEKQRVQPFSEIEITFTGDDGAGRLQLSGATSEGPLDAVFFEWDNDGNLRNGDQITVRYNGNKLQQYLPEYYVEPADTSRTFVVSGLTEQEEGMAQSEDSYMEDYGIPNDLVTSASWNGFILDESDEIPYDRAFLETLTEKQLRYARNEICARAGRTFKDAELQQYFNERWWYYPMYEPDEFDQNINQILTPTGKANMDLIAAVEAAR